MTTFSPHHTQDKHTSVAVIGAGIVGLCSAIQLQQQGFNVTLIDRDGVCQGASKGNAGHFATEQVFPLADKSLLPQIPGMLLDPLGPFRIKPSYIFKAMPWFIRFLLNMRTKPFNQNKEALKRLNEAAIPAYQRLLNITESNEFMTLKGSLLTFENATDAEVNKQLNAFRENGVNVEKLNQQQTLALEPALSNNIQASLFFTDVGHSINPEKLGKSLFAHFEQQGGEFIQDKVSQISHHAYGVKLTIKDETQRFDKVLIATGAWSKQLANQLGYKVPLDTERGYHLMLPMENTLTRPVASADRKFIMTQMDEGLRLAGTVEFAGLNAEKNEARAKALLPHAKQMLNDVKITDEQALENWMGFRPSLPDSLPVIGQAPNHKDVYFAFGHQHLGLTLAAVTAEIVADLFTNKKPSIDAKPYCISRFN